MQFSSPTASLLYLNILLSHCLSFKLCLVNLWNDNIKIWHDDVECEGVLWIQFT
jgi:hypothetical protein